VRRRDLPLAGDGAVDHIERHVLVEPGEAREDLRAALPREIVDQAHARRDLVRERHRELVVVAVEQLRVITEPRVQRHPVHDTPAILDEAADRRSWHALEEFLAEVLK